VPLDGHFEPEESYHRCRECGVVFKLRDGELVEAGGRVPRFTQEEPDTLRTLQKALRAIKIAPEP
jgi:hypothetical protein